jgi:NAD(P)-dependent dehydrogenase (short-subunit alcohol dehydrogenase family)
MDLELAGKRVLVTGAGKGLGLAIVRAFRAEGAEVVGVSRNGSPELEATGATFVAADLSRPDEPRRVIDTIGPRLDVLVNNAGGGVLPDEAFGDIFDGDDDVWADLLALNLMSAVRMTRAALPALTESRGSVVNISSDSALRPWTTPLPYSTGKAALNALSRGLAEKLAPSGVRVNTLTPSGMRTDVWESEDGHIARVARHLGLDRATLAATQPVEGGMLTGRLSEPGEIARAVLVLASPALPSAIGANWHVTAGSVKAV